MGQYTSYYLYQRQEKIGDQDWQPCYPNQFSIDGDGEMPLVVKSSADTNCGYVQPQEQTRTISQGQCRTDCTEVITYYNQISTDGGATWTTISTYKEYIPNSERCCPNP